MDGFSKFHFKDLGENEQIIKVVHRNWFYLMEQFLFVGIFAGIFFAGISYAPLFFPNMIGKEFVPVVAFLENFFMLAIWMYSFMIWIDYYFDIWIITTERIVNIDQEGMFARKVSEVNYAKIQDITTGVVGFIPSILNYGDVLVQTAGELEDIKFKTVSDPYSIKNIIIEQQKKSQHNSTEELGDMIKEKIGA